ncbi:MAG: hypothetical protein KDE19_11675 [Caldilineaceae bacterium]|nr:hypothetical protein [Caldilineaceae bacterium]
MLLTTLILGFFALLFISATVAPLGSLGWWAGWFGEELSLDEIEDADGDGSILDDLATAFFHVNPDQPTQSNQDPSDAGVTARRASTAQADANADGDSARDGHKQQPKPQQAAHYIVYLSGIGAFTGSSIPREELPFIEALRTQVSNSAIITDVFPYSVTNLGLTGERLFARIWRYIEAQRPHNPNSLWLYLVVLRNLFQVMVAADRRYGPIYNLGVAREIWRSLLQHGYRPDSKTPLTLIGVSGGAQIAIGAVSYLSKVIGAPIQIISLGGVIASDPGLLKVKHLYHLYGANDSTHKIGPLLFPGRWSVSANSAWNRALRRGLITMKETGPADHVGKDSHFDPDAFAPDGRSYFQITLDEVLAILQPAASTTS